MATTMDPTEPDADTVEPVQTPVPELIEGVSLAQYGAVLAGLGEQIGLDLLLADQAITPTQWERAEDAWGELLGEERAFALGPRLDAALAAGRRRYGRRVEPLDADFVAWLRVVRHCAESGDFLAAAGRLGLRPSDMLRLHGDWAARCHDRPALLRDAEGALGGGADPLPALVFGSAWEPDGAVRALAARRERERAEEEELEADEREDDDGADETSAPEAAGAAASERPPLFSALAGAPAIGPEPERRDAPAPERSEPPPAAQPSLRAPLPIAAPGQSGATAGPQLARRPDVDPLNQTLGYSPWVHKEREALPFRESGRPPGAPAASRPPPPPAERPVMPRALPFDPADAGPAPAPSQPPAPDPTVLPFRPASVLPRALPFDRPDERAVPARMPAPAHDPTVLPFRPASSHPPAAAAQPSRSSDSNLPSPSHPPPRAAQPVTPAPAVPPTPAPRPAPAAPVAPRLTLDEYASIEAELSLRADDAAAILRRYGFVQASFGAERAAWAARMAREPALRGHYQQRLRTFQDWIRRRR